MFDVRRLFDDDEDSEEYFRHGDDEDEDDEDLDLDVDDDDDERPEGHLIARELSRCPALLQNGLDHTQLKNIH